MSITQAIATALANLELTPEQVHRIVPELFRALTPKPVPPPEPPPGELAIAATSTEVVSTDRGEMMDAA